MVWGSGVGGKCRGLCGQSEAGNDSVLDVDANSCVNVALTLATD